jgi:hypothetical protein
MSTTLGSGIPPCHSHIPVKPRQHPLIGVYLPQQLHPRLPDPRPLQETIDDLGMCPVTASQPRLPVQLDVFKKDRLKREEEAFTNAASVAPRTAVDNLDHIRGVTASPAAVCLFIVALKRVRVKEDGRIRRVRTRVFLMTFVHLLFVIFLSNPAIERARVGCVEVGDAGGVAGFILSFWGVYLPCGLSRTHLWLPDMCKIM